MSIPRTTHPWLQPLYNRLEGKGTIPLSLGSPTGVIQLYGQTGATYMRQIATGTNSVLGASSVGSSGALMWANGGSGAYYTLNDLVLANKNAGILKP